MSLSSSIFQKPCPDCAASVSASAPRCRCGHVFEAAADSLSPLDAALHDEELYASYLAARAEQARQAARAAEGAMFDDTNNAELASACALAREVAKTIAADLAEQMNKIAAIRNSIRERQTAAPAPAVSSANTGHSTVTNKPAPARSGVAPSLTSPAKPASSPAWQASTAEKAAGVLAALKSAKTRESIARARQAAVATPSSAVPPADFRKDQASRADKIVEARKAADDKECPNCTSIIPINTTRCRCGFAFVDVSTELPPLTLCTGDFTALRNSLPKNNPR
jgi:hypothetical protein